MIMHRKVRDFCSYEWRRIKVKEKQRFLKRQLEKYYYLFSWDYLAGCYSAVLYGASNG